MKKINCKIAEMFRNMDNLFNEFVKMMGEKEFDNHWSGIFVVKYIDDHNTTRTKKMMSIPNPEKELKYGTLALEKADRLHRNIFSGHLTSYESRNPEAEVFFSSLRNERWGYWGGAVLISKHFIFSFSGLPELLDEAFVCFLGLKSGLLSKCQFGLIRKRRLDNPYLEVLNTVLIKKKK